MPARGACTQPSPRVAAGLRLAYSGPLDCARSTLLTEGILGFYKGLSVPLVGTMLETACLFAVNAKLKAMLEGLYGAPLSLWHTAVAGGITGESTLRVCECVVR